MAKKYHERRKEDERKERIVTDFAEIKILKKFPDYRRNKEVITQKLGNDFEFTGRDGYHYICDLKAIFKSIPTGCLECACRINRNNNWDTYINGWFLNEREIANTYVMFWLDEFNKEMKSIEDIKHGEICFIKKERLWDYIKECGFSKEAIMQKIEEIKNNPERYFKTEWISDVGFNCPKNYYDAERPVNILLKRNIYRELSIYTLKF